MLHGGSDTDTATYEGNKADYRIEYNNASVTVTLLSDETDTDTLVNIENIQFADETVNVEAGAELSVLVTLYQSVLGRQADLEGIEFWASVNVGNVAQGSTVMAMLTSAEAVNQYGVDLNNLGNGVTSGEAVNYLYTALLGRTADQGGLDFWSTVIDQGGDITDIAAAFATSAELSTTALQNTGWDFIV